MVEYKNWDPLVPSIQRVQVYRGMTLTLGATLSRIRTERSGVIPYAIRGGDLYLLLARDRKTHELTDFGGGVKRDEFALNGGLREFRQESRAIFDDEGVYDSNSCTHVAAIADKTMSLLFVPLHAKWLHRAATAFDERKTIPPYNSGCYDEVRKIEWLSEKVTRRMLKEEPSALVGGHAKNRKLWSRVHRFLQQHMDDDVWAALKGLY